MITQARTLKAGKLMRTFSRHHNKVERLFDNEAEIRNVKKKKKNKEHCNLRYAREKERFKSERKELY